jgi:hypothetical protein
MEKKDLPAVVVKALTAMGGSASIPDVSRYIWENHQDDLSNSGDLFYTWQYDIRWAATKLRKEGKLKNTNRSPSGVWEVVRP